MRTRRRLVVALALLAVGGAGLHHARRHLEDRALAAVRASLGARGLAVRDVEISWRGPIRLAGLAEAASPARFVAEAVDVEWDLRGGRDLRAHVRGLAVRGLRVTRGPLLVEWPRAEFDVTGWTRDAAAERISLRQRAGGGMLHLRWAADGSRGVALEANALDLGSARVSWGGEPVLEPGRWTGRLEVVRGPDALETTGDLQGDGARVGLPGAMDLGRGLGTATAVALRWDARHGGGTLEVRRAALRVAGLEIEARGSLAGDASARTLDARASLLAEIASTFQTLGVPLPATLDALRGRPLGTARLEVSARGPLADPAALEIAPLLVYEPDPSAAEALAFLRRPFRIATPDRPGAYVEVRDGGSGFVPLEALPPLFVRAVLLSEDAGFYGHPGVDVAEIPAAWAANLERGAAARGASTITQQLVKNLFLSPEKTYGRKVMEAALALVLDAAVPKGRLLEIYVNVIEWGPGLHGLVPAARHYFGKTPAALTPKEIAFLVCLIPSPVRYHQAHVAGRAGPGMEQLMASLLAKLRSVGALTDAEYAAAVDEELAFQPEDAGRIASARP